MAHPLAESPRTSFLQPSTISRETLYTVPNKHTGMLVVFILTNSDTVTRTMLVEYYDVSTTTYHTLFHKDVAGHDSVIFGEHGSVVLEAGDKLVLTATTANTITAIATVHETLDAGRN